MFSSKESAKFWTYVDVASSDDCWNWTGGRYYNQFDYGGVRMAGQKRYAHRVAFEIGHGVEPIGCVRHTCKNSRCCNPGHLVDCTFQEVIANRRARRDRRVSETRFV